MIFEDIFFLTLCYINWPNFIVWLPLFQEMLDHMCIVTICFPSRFLTWSKKLGQKFKYVKNEKNFKGLIIWRFSAQAENFNLWLKELKNFISYGFFHLGLKISHPGLTFASFFSVTCSQFLCSRLRLTISRY